MVQDVAISKDINTAFKEWCEQNDEEVALDLSISVLATGTWPLQSRPTQFVVPQALVGPMDLFKTFYATKYSGRKLAYLHHLSKVDLQVTYTLEGPLCVTATTFQLGILAHYDTAGTDQLTLGDIASATLLQERDIKIALLGMLKLKFIRCAAGPKHSTWNESTTFALVKNFKSARIRILLDVPVAADGLKSAALAQVEAREMRCEREFRLRAAIVRVMKARQTITHQQLISEAIRSVHKWFTPTVALIEYLIESEYIAIDETNLELVSYSYRA
jgi:cullin 1